MTRKIAIIKMREVPYSEYGDPEGYQMIVQSITDWQEVSDEDYRTLQLASGSLGFKILEQPTDVPAYIAKTIKEYTALARAEEARLAEEKRKREDAALQRRLKKELKDEKTKKALYEKLKEEFEAK